jgi:hypothetical protein
MKKKKFIGKIIDAGGGGAYVEIPFDVEKEFGSKRPKIKATIDSEPYRGSLLRMGTQCHILGILKEIRTKIGKAPGDEVAIIIESDDKPRVVEIPGDFQKALDDDPIAKEEFARFSYSHKREWVLWIENAKKAETRESRILKAIATLKNPPKK